MSFSKNIKNNQKTFWLFKSFLAVQGIYIQIIQTIKTKIVKYTVMGIVLDINIFFDMLE